MILILSIFLLFELIEPINPVHKMTRKHVNVLFCIAHNSLYVSNRLTRCPTLKLRAKHGPTSLSRIWHGCRSHCIFVESGEKPKRQCQQTVLNTGYSEVYPIKTHLVRKHRLSLIHDNENNFKIKEVAQ